MSLGFNRAEKGSENFSVLLNTGLEMLETLLSFGQNAVNEHLLSLNQLDDLLTCFFGHQSIQNNLGFRVVCELRSSSRFLL